MSTNRLQKLQALIAEEKLDALLVSQTENLCYLSDFTGSSGWLVLSANNSVLATDSRYTEQARRETDGFEILKVTGGPDKWLPSVTCERGLTKVGFEAKHTSFAIYRQLCEVFNSEYPTIQLIPIVDIVEKIRVVKEPQELELLAKAAELADAGFKYALSIIHPGMKERDLAWDIEVYLRQLGSESLPFHIIVASGANAALPHAKATDKVISCGEPVLIDMGARFQGYCSDLSRTICLGKSDQTFSRLYDLVLKAQLAAIAGAKPGIQGLEVDRLARNIIEEAGYGEAFGHSLGHGVGLDGHELPAISPGSASLLQEGMVFTIEPGVYISGWGGIRIEDMVVLEDNKASVLTKAEKLTVAF